MTFDAPSNPSFGASLPHIPVAVNNFLDLQGWGRIATTTALAGGMHSQTMRVHTEHGPSAILKLHIKETSPDGVYYREAEGLRALVQPGGPRIPEVYVVGDAFLLMEDLGARKAEPTDQEWERFGQAIAALHRCTNDRFGFQYSDQAISSNPNDPLVGRLPWTDDGVGFWLERHILCFLSWPLVEETLTAQERRAVEVYANVFRQRVPCDRPALVHGDLWRANMLITQSGAPALIDPDVSFGLRESDIAIAIQGEGIPERFFAAYDEAFPLPEGWRERLELYYMHIAIGMIAFTGNEYGYLQMLRDLLQKYP
jgi:fructosamine-3-kinase